MTPQQFELELRKTLDDRRLSRGERRALQELVRGTDGDELPLLRNIAFKVARAELDDSPATRQVIDWLEEVVKVLVADRGDEPPPSSQAYFSPGTEPLRKIVGLLSAVRTSCDICVFTITDDRIAEAILDCHRRGVLVRIISDDDKAFDRGSDIHDLQQQGVRVRVDHSPHHMHHKFALFDRRTLLTGSYNWTRSAAAHNHENVIVTSDHQLASAFGELFDRLWHELK